MEKKLILVFGRICSGKSSYKPELPRITVSNTVRSLFKELIGDTNADRAALQTTLSLDQQIAERLLSQIDALEVEGEVIVDGIRQVSIVRHILTKYSKAILVFLEVPTEERKRRYESRADIKDVEPFEIADNKPIELQIDEILEVFKEDLIIVNN